MSGYGLRRPDWRRFQGTACAAFSIAAEIGIAVGCAGTEYITLDGTLNETCPRNSRYTKIARKSAAFTSLAPALDDCRRPLLLVGEAGVGGAAVAPQSISGAT